MCLAIPGRILSIESIDSVQRVAQVDFGSVVKSVNLLYTPEASLGDYVIVQAGFSVRRLGESEARESLAYASQLNGLLLSGSEPTRPARTPAPEAEVSSA